VRRELIVVDNGPSDATREVVARHASDRSDIPVRYCAEPRRGHAHARNRGVAMAGGEFLLFADDDVIVEDGWADALVAVFADPATAAAGGRILPRWSSAPPPWVRRPHADLATLPDYGTEYRLMGGWELPVGANAAIRKAVLDEIGLTFDTNLGHRGKMSFGFEEFDLFTRILERYSIAYVPEALVHHRVAGERLTHEGMRRLHYQRGFGTGRWERRNGNAVPGLRPRAVEALRFCFRALRRRVRNSRSADLTADKAWDEFNAYLRAGQSLEHLFGRFPRVADWLATRPV
jgi:glycosyltransferase involved in cell wall biosynthesis